MMQHSFMLNPTHSDSEDVSSPEPQRVVLPSIFTMMENRGVFLDPKQMTPFGLAYLPSNEQAQVPSPHQIALTAQPIIQPNSYITNSKTIQTSQKNTINIPNNSAQHPARKRKESKRTLFSEKQRSILMHWLRSHQSNPYPTSIEKQELMEKTGLNRDQINVWFTNNRVRHGLSTSSQHHSHSSKYVNMFKQ